MEELFDEAEVRRVFFLIQQLRPRLHEEEYIRAVRRMQKEGYRLFAWKEGKSITAAAGLRFQENLYNGFHMWLDDFVTDERKRSQGIGRKALSDIESFAESQGAELVALSSGLERTLAHSFYEDKMQYSRKSYVFSSPLLDEKEGQKQ
ncbi:GNAT family N-acetyltransferase [Salibacterium halotolerans]|uniref:Acetyltransferase (GNAT) family protein n=1 Tax=Salibacterium halotolerans TaxID=1884432 RepID=A0A1I5QFE3_9BACI|nr:GNAT family N-acetyltransferase [Salibacterium halotolerans]SFP44847.1 Acetyltransferase (GNAT) family protein [Salibacterium halotolerans]